MFDLLEPRIALSASGGTDQTDAGSSLAGGAADVAGSTQGQPFSVELVDPAPGVTFHESPATLILKFNHPIFPDTVSTDVGIVQTDGDGNPTGWYTVPDQDQLSLDDSATRLTVNVGQALPPGHYQVWLFGNSGITDIDGNLLVPDGNTLILGDFDVMIAGVTLSDAVDLPTPGPTPIDVSGTLDFQADPYAVSLYRIQLEPGRLWRLGLEVTAPKRDGGALDTALALFDEAGRPIAEAESGRNDTPEDPFLFAGIQPGTYYVGVSGTGNLPGQAGGYDPVTGSPGSVAQTQTGGDYTLHFLADRVVTPPELRTFTVDHGDALSAAPTGLTLAFTRAIALPTDTGALSGALTQGIELLDAEGRAWPVQASAYDEADARISYLFDQALAPGHYTVRLPEQGGLVDLAGLSPVAPGEPHGVLGAFDVTPQTGPSDPHDLGALLPYTASQGFSLDLSLSPGASVSYRVVVTVPAIYQFQIHSGGAVPSIQIEGAGLTHSIGPGGTNDTQLVPAEYSIRVQNTGTEATHGQLDVRAADVITDLFLASGVGQGPGLSLRLIAFSEPEIQPPSASPTVTPLPAPSASPIAAPVSLESTPAEIDPGAGDSALTTRPLALGLSSGRFQTAPVVTISFLGMGSDLIGRPWVTAPRGAPSELGTPSPNDAIAFKGVALGQQVSRSREIPVRLDTSEPELADIGHVVVERPRELMAANAGIDPSRLISLIESLRDGIVAMRTAASGRVKAWLGQRPSSESSQTEVVTGGSSSSIVPSRDVTDAASDLEQVEPTHEADSWTDLLSPAIVSVSVASVAQMARQFSHWRRFRNRSRARETTERLERCLASNEPESSDQLESWVDGSDLSEAQQLISRAS
jgi:hypothetical protein